MQLPPVSYLINEALKTKKGSHKPGREFIGTLNKSQIKEIAEFKMPDLNCSTIESAMNIVAGQCRSMGVKVED
jgi:large subunit ribosomal protein L11